MKQRLIRRLSTFVSLAVLCTAVVVLQMPTSALAEEEHELVLGEVNVRELFKVEAVLVEVEAHQARGQAAGHPEGLVHFEALVKLITNFGGQHNGFFPALNISVDVRNERTGEVRHARLGTFLNSSDGFHYGQNVRLPGKPERDAYAITYTISPPRTEDLTLHLDMIHRYGTTLFRPTIRTFTLKPGAID